MTTRAQVTFQSTTGLAEDAYVNTFHFGSIAQGKYAEDVVELILRDFYITLHGDQTHSLTAWMSEAVSRVNPATIKLYDLNDPEPRVPYSTMEFTPDDPHGASNFPEEVAVCLSWKAAPVSGVPLGRLRGRTYIGPLVIDAGDVSLGKVRPVPTLRNDLRRAGEFLIGAGAADLVIYSATATPPIASPVVGGFIDDAFDTLRSRGPAPTERTILTP